MGQVKLSVNLSEETVGALRALAERRGVSMTEVIRRAISDAKYLDDAVREGKKILIEDSDRNIKEIVFR